MPATAVKEPPLSVKKAPKKQKPRGENRAASVAPPSKTPTEKIVTLPATVTLELVPDVAGALQAEAEKWGMTLEAVALDALHRGLRQILWGDNNGEWLKRAGLEPRKPLPPGKTLKDVMDELRSSLPPEEDPYTDEDYLRVLGRK